MVKGMYGTNRPSWCGILNHGGYDVCEPVSQAKECTVIRPTGIPFSVEKALNYFETTFPGGVWSAVL